MPHNKGRVLRLCKECKKKRFCSQVVIPGTNYRYICSKGHSWVIAGITLERVNLAMKNIFTKKRIESLFNREDVFFKSLKRY